MRNILIIFFIITLVLSKNYANSIKIYTKLDNSPYSYMENNKLKGIYVSILNNIFNKINNFEVKQIAIDSQKVIKDMKNKKILALNGLYYRPENNKYIEKYTEPIFYENIVLMCNNNILNKKREIFPDDFYDLNISKNISISINSDKLIINNKKSTKDGILKLASNKINCFIDSEFSVLAELSKLKNSNKKLKNIENILTISKEQVYIGFSKKNHLLKDNLIKKINLAIRVMKNSGEIDEIVNNYLSDLLTQDSIKKIDAVTYNWGGTYVSDKFDTLGLIPEIVSLAFKEVNIDVNYELKSSQYAYLLTKWKQKSFSFPFYKTKDNKQYMIFSDPVLFSDVILLYNKNKFPNGIKFNSFKDLRNYKIGGVKGVFYEDIFIKNSLNYTLTENFEKLLDLFIFNKVDIIPSNLKVFIDIMQKKYPDKLQDFNFHNKKIFSSEAIYLIFPKNINYSQELKDLFNKGLLSIKKTGVLKKIFTKYGLTKREYLANVNKINSFKKNYKKTKNNITKFIDKVKKDKKIEKKLEAKLKNRKYNNKNLVKLYIETEPTDTTIQIMDIKESFYQGIKLKKGIFRLRILKSGYKTLNKKIIIGDNKTVTLKFKLQKD